PPAFRACDRPGLWANRAEKSMPAWRSLCGMGKSAIPAARVRCRIVSRGWPLFNENTKPALAPATTATGAGGPGLRLAVIVPTLNERDNVHTMVAALDAALAGIAWEAVFVDDNSHDGTPEEIERIARTRGNIRLIRRIGRKGLSAA